MTVRVDIKENGVISRAKRRTNRFHRKFIMEFLRTVVMKTPVNTGLLRGSWYISVNGSTPAMPAEPDKSGTATLAKANIVAQRIDLNDNIFLLNNAEYARFVEYGTSAMAPRSFVRNTILEAQMIAEMVAIDLGFRL